MNEVASNLTDGGRAGRSIVIAAVVFVLVVLALSGGRSYRQLAAANDRAAELEGQIAEAEEHVETQERRIERFQDDPQLLERLAREELGMVRPGEVVILLPAEDLEGGDDDFAEARLPAEPEAPSSEP